MYLLYICGIFACRMPVAPCPAAAAAPVRVASYKATSSARTTTTGVKKTAWRESRQQSCYVAVAWWAVHASSMTKIHVAMADVACCMLLVVLYSYISVVT